MSYCAALALAALTIDHPLVIAALLGTVVAAGLRAAWATASPPPRGSACRWPCSSR